MSLKNSLPLHGVFKFTWWQLYHDFWEKVLCLSQLKYSDQFMSYKHVYVDSLKIILVIFTSYCLPTPSRYT